MPTLKVWNGSEWEYLTGGAPILQQDAEPGSPVEDDLWIDTDEDAQSGSFVADAARVDTSQATTSTTYTDLATAGPAVTVATGTRALVMLSGFFQANIVNAQAWMSVAVSGATTIAAADGNAMEYQAYTGGGGGQMGSTILITGLTPGSNTFTAKYRTVATATGTFAYRTIAVIPLP